MQMQMGVKEMSEVYLEILSSWGIMLVPPPCISVTGNHSQHCSSEGHAALMTDSKISFQVSFASNNGAA